MNYETETIRRLKDPRGVFIDLVCKALEDKGFTTEVGSPINQDSAVIIATKGKANMNVVASGREIRMNSALHDMLNLVDHRIQIAEDLAKEFNA